MRHGLGISEEVEEITAGSMVLGPGTLYRSLKMMVEDGLVSPHRSSRPNEDPRRKFYSITERGREALSHELSSLQRIVDAARMRKVLVKEASQ